MWGFAICGVVWYSIFTNMRKKMKHALIPHSDNDYKPTLFHFASISAVLVVGIIFFISSLAANKYILTTQQGAAVYSSVLVDLTNKARAENDASNLVVSNTLTKAAQMKADDMAARQYFAHTSPDGTTPWYWFQKSGYAFAYAGENLAVDFTESADVENAWLASPKHRENIVDSRFTEIGIATKTAMWQGRQTTFVVQLFGAPSRVAMTTPAVSQNLSTTASDVTIKTNVAQSTLEPKEAQVAGASKISLNEKIKVVSENLNTIVVQNTAVPDVGGLSSVGLAAQTKSSNVSLIDKAIVHIPNISSFALTALALIILLGLILFVFIEVKRQHPKHVIVGIIAFFIISTLAYGSHALTLFT